MKVKSFVVFGFLFVCLSSPFASAVWFQDVQHIKVYFIDVEEAVDGTKVSAQTTCMDDYGREVGTHPCDPDNKNQAWYFVDSNRGFHYLINYSAICSVGGNNCLERKYDDTVKTRPASQLNQCGDRCLWAIGEGSLLEPHGVAQGRCATPSAGTSSALGIVGRYKCVRWRITERRRSVVGLR